MSWTTHTPVTHGHAPQRRTRTHTSDARTHTPATRTRTPATHAQHTSDARNYAHVRACTHACACAGMHACRHRYAPYFVLIPAHAQVCARVYHMVIHMSMHIARRMRIHVCLGPACVSGFRCPATRLFWQAGHCPAHSDVDRQTRAQAGRQECRRGVSDWAAGQVAGT